MFAVLSTLLLSAAVAAQSADSTPSPTINRICLNIMVKNEAKDLPQMLPAISDHLSGWVLCDTGSTDGTVEMVEKYFAEKGVPGRVVHHSWTDNFARNRNMCLEEGVRYSKDVAPPGEEEGCDYHMFLDADQFLVMEDDGLNLKTMDLTEDAYYMRERGTSSGAAEYVNIRLASTRLEWQWEGAVHEVVSSITKPLRSEPLQTIPGMFFLHDASGGSDGKRFARDAKILEQEIAEQPNNARAHFYLGQTYYSLRRWHDALKQYKHRSTMNNGWVEENFQSALSYADILKYQWQYNKTIDPIAYEHLSSWTKNMFGEDPVTTIIRAYYAAHEILPYRAEPLHRLARVHHEFQNNYVSCFNTGMMAYALPIPPPTALFFDTNGIKFELLDEICVCGYYAKQLERGLAVCQELEQRLVGAKDDVAPPPPFTDRMLERTRANIQYYAKALGRVIPTLDMAVETHAKAEAQARSEDETNAKAEAHARSKAPARSPSGPPQQEGVCRNPDSKNSTSGGSCSM